ncbi:hypothetical protein V8B55DRAFT_1545051 [Mucor lusitanicus]
MSALENLTEGFSRINFDASPHQAWLSGHHQRTSNRNLRIMPSDDEDEDEDEDEAIYSSEDSGQKSLRKTTKPKKLTKPKATIPLPSDEEDNTDEEDDDDDEHDDELLPIHQSMRRPMHGGLPYRINRSAPTLPQQFEPHPSQHLFMQHSDGSTNSNHSSSVATHPQNQRSVSTDDLSRFLKDGQHQNKSSGEAADDEDDQVIGQHLRHASNSLDVPPTIHHMHQYQQYHQQQQLAQFQYLQQQQQQYVANTSMQPRNQKQQQPMQPSQQQQRMTTMSGMDLLIQREQEKAEAKRQKPKMNPGKVKIEGLLGKLPEPGTHNINFQQIQQQQQQQQQQQHQLQQQMHQQHYMNSPVPTINGNKKYSHANRQVYYQQQQQQQQAYGYVPNPPSMYDYYSNGRSSVPPMYSAQPSFYQLPNYTSSGNLYTTMMAAPGSQSLPHINRPGSAMSSYPNSSNLKQQPRSTTPVSFSPQQYQQQ